MSGKVKNLKNLPIYVYTDGGSTDVGGALIGASAFRIYYNWTTYTTGTMLEGATNNKAELEAIDMALKELADKDPQTLRNKQIYIMTDSEIAIKGIYRGAKELKKYYEKLDETDQSLVDDDIYETLNELELHTAEGKILKNQETIKKILCKIFDLERVTKSELPIYKNIRFFHIPAHLSASKMDDINKVIKRLKTQKYDCDIEMAEKIIKANRTVDAVCTALMGQSLPAALREEYPHLKSVNDFFSAEGGVVTNVSLF